MQQSLLLHDGTSAQSNEIPNLIHCFDLGGSGTYCPFINIPYATENNYQTVNPVIATSGLTEPENELWYGKDYFASSGTAIIQIDDLSGM